MLRCLLTLLLLGLTTGCAFVSPRFPQNIQASFVRDDMRKLTTRSLELYYPAPMRSDALRIAARVEDCVDRLRQHTPSPRERKRVLAYLTSADFNNAYVQSSVASLPQQMVLPGHMTLELFHLMGLGAAELGDVGCHEAVHYVQMQQVDGLWGAVNTVTGGFFQPNVFTESWFLEGLATYYEGQLGREVGRPHSPVWRGWFEAMAQENGGHLHPGHMHPGHREALPFGGNYLTGSYFVAWLARTYGEDKLWKLVDAQGSSIFSPFGVTLRFQHVYGRDIGSLFEQFSQAQVRDLKPRTRPGTQQVLQPSVGYFARMTASPADGAVAVVSEERTQPTRLTVYERDGRVRFQRGLTQYIPGRPWIITDPLAMSGLSFTADGASLFLVVADLDAESSYLARLWQVDARTGDVVRTWEGLQGMGGSVTPDGQAYVYVRMQGNTANLVRLDLARGEHTPLTRSEGHQSFGPPAVSPDGTRLAFPVFTAGGWNLMLREPDGTLRPLTQDGDFNYAPRWLDADRLIFLREYEGRWQVALLDVATGAVERLTDAPHLVMDAAPQGEGYVAFLNREGVGFSLDRAPVAPLATGATAAPERTPPAAGEAPAAPTPEPVPPTLELLSDTAYSPLDGLFSPVLHLPYAYALPTDTTAGFGVYAGLSLAGQDRLGFHQYALNLEFEFLERQPSLSLSYGNSLLAPWYLQASVSRTHGTDARALQGVLSASRRFWTTPVFFSLLALRQDWFDSFDTPGGVSTSLFGTEVGTSYFAGESTPVGGTQWGLGLSLSLGAYPAAFVNTSASLTDTRAFGDARAEVDVYLPGLPLLTQDSLQLSVVGRTLPGAPRGLLQVGGIQLGQPLYVRRREEDPRSARNLPRQLQPGAAFAESLRGYEDFALSARNALIGGVLYRHFFIIDRGWASTLWLGPSFFIEEVELQGFASWARTDLRADHRAAGGAVFLRTTLGQSASLSLFYQYAARFDDGLGPLHLVGLAL
jgi:hypothetical protein